MLRRRRTYKRALIDVNARVNNSSFDHDTKAQMTRRNRQRSADAIRDLDLVQRQMNDVIR